MPKVCILTPMRDCAATLAAYRERLTRLDWPAADLRFVIVEGDSSDGTPALLREWAAADDRVSVVTCDTGRPRYGSIVHPERFLILATVFNAGLDCILAAGWADYMLMLPADVAYGPELVRGLVARDKDIIAPLFWRADGYFYDIWGFTWHGGQGWQPWDRPGLLGYLGTAPVSMETVGGAALVRWSVLAAGVRYPAADVDRGFCRMAIERGFTVWADPTTHVTHGSGSV